ncbi:bifunctional riboflavin kinase/FAD synthetase [Bacillus taeanensis]|uniref:Riboflavin biosynthesis protein n=1 Tax=Bacillus taeanensis TaxID=273032 RepID=A0A366XWG3_9BACI|nr:bifunctional riboflavin kinase/FAD synthetase [Bacillus taeanensis]RBW69888.1 bifunctional riboflavin kinase/FAD synthetase [Bacillus taeanensis]
MKTVYLNYPQTMNKGTLNDCVMALGYFDGIHLGHQKVINTAKNIADKEKLETAVMTFDPPPAVVLGHKPKMSYITPISEKEKLIRELGVDTLYIVRFTLSFANLTPQQFIDDYIIGLSAKHVVAGFDYTYGRLGKGTMETISFHSRGQFDHTIVHKVEEENIKISSTLIRECIQKGEVEVLPNYLGRFYYVKGIVSDGEKRGRTIGFPTANITLSEDYLIPKLGVYAVKMTVGNHTYTGVCNVGFKPTFHNEKPEFPTIEVHLFHFDQNIYKERVAVEWHKRLRDEKKFSSVEQLVAQIGADKEQALHYFSMNKEDK